MLISSDLVTDLAGDTPFTDKTLAFVKSVMDGLLYVEATPAGDIISGQVKKGGGDSVVAVTNVAVRTIAAVGGTIAVGTGTAMAGAGTVQCWLQTTGAGAFQVTITHTGACLVEITPHQGVTMVVTLA